MTKPKYPSTEQTRERTEWGNQWHRCMVCNTKQVSKPLEIHEIASKGQAPKRWAFVENYLAVCQGCHHQLIHGASETRPPMSHAMQLFYKRRAEPENYDPAKICEAMRRAVTFVTDLDVTLAGRGVECVSETEAIQ